MRKLILVAAVLSFGLVSLIPYGIETMWQRRILAATVMITITAPNWQRSAEPMAEALPIPNDEYRPIARAEEMIATDGLGTLVADGDDLLLVTHDHWSRLDEASGTVTFRASDGTWLAEMDLRAFRQYLRFRDGGTMVLTAPEVLAATASGKAEASQFSALAVGDDALLAQRSGDRVVVTRANVIAQSDRQGASVVRLQGQDGQVRGGDSGGGVWVGGRFAATMWTTVMLEDTETGERQATDMSVAAIYAR